MSGRLVDDLTGERVVDVVLGRRVVVVVVVVDVVVVDVVVVVVVVGFVDVVVVGVVSGCLVVVGNCGTDVVDAVVVSTMGERVTRREDQSVV